MFHLAVVKEKQIKTFIKYHLHLLYDINNDNTQGYPGSAEISTFRHC